MHKLVMVLAVLAASVNLANAESPTWTNVQRACGTEYREADKASRGTWQEFLSTCKVRKGFVAKSGKADFRLPDVQ